MFDVFDNYEMSKNAVAILKDRIFLKHMEEYTESKWEHVSRRVARYVATAVISDGFYEGDDLLKEIKRKEEIYFELINKRIFLPNSPTMFNAGEGMPIEWFRKDIDLMDLDDYMKIYNNRTKHNMLSACFVNYTEDDSMDGIFEYVKKSALILKYGGGVGYDFSTLRPKGAVVHGTSGYSSGPISFMSVYNTSASTIQQGGKRRAAQMGVMKHDHPDIMDFIHAKKNNNGNNVLSYFNISVNLDNTEDFLEKYQNGENYDLTFKGTKYGELSAKSMLNTMAENAWKAGDPGLLFLGRHNEYYANANNTPVTATNPCFGYDEKILTDKGEISIGELDGQTVNVWSPFDNEYVKADVFKTGDKKTITLVTDNLGSLTVTPEHKVFDHETQDWMEAKDMLNRKIAVFEYIDSKFSEEKDPSIVPYGYVTEIIENGIEPVYDFSMDKTHAGVVNGFICHNCGEETLPNHGSCNLGSLNLKIINEKYPEFYVVGTKDFDAFHEVVKHTTTFLDDVVSVNMYPLDELAETAKDQRFIGLGLMGFADLLYEKEIPYGDKQARNLAAEIQASIAYFAHLTSSELGQEKGNFRSFDKSRYVDGHIPFPMHTESNEVLDVTDNLKQLNELIKEHFATTARRWKRNVQVNTIAPTGTLSNISDVSAGLEPNFSLAYTRFLLNKNGKRVPMLYINEMLKKYIKEHDNEYYLELMEKVEKFQIEAEKVEDYKTVDELVAIEDEIMKLNDLSNLNGVDEKMKKVFVTAQSIKPLEHLYMQVAFQEYIDASVSKTINMPNEATIEDVKNIYLAALKYFIKGITIYRDGSLSMQVLETKKKDKDQNKEEEHKKTQHMVDGYSFILDQNHKIRPKPRLETMPAINKKVKTQEGTTYINVSADIDTLSPAEIFISNGHDTAEVIGRLSSVALRAGVSQEEIVKQLKKTKGSYVPEIGKALEDAFKEIPEILSNVTIKKKTKKTHYSKEEMKDMVYDSKSNVYLDDEGNTVCPACGEVNSMRKTEGCVTCTNCGTAKCL